MGRRIEISLPENPTTGFRWQAVQLGEPVVELIEKHFVPGLKATGETGLQVWKFKVTAEGAATIQLVYRRSWESDAAAANIFSLQVRGKR